MSDSSSDEHQAQPDAGTLDQINSKLDQLLPEIPKWRRSRWVTWILSGVVVVLIVVLGLGAYEYVHQRHVDARERDERRAALETALQSECRSSVRQTGDTRKAIQVVLTTAVARSDNPDETKAIAADINQQLDATIRPRNCDKEARQRAESG